jgi:hypothetical protein
LALNTNQSINQSKEQKLEQHDLPIPQQIIGGFRCSGINWPSNNKPWKRRYQGVVYPKHLHSVEKLDVYLDQPSHDDDHDEFLRGDLIVGISYS